MNPTLREPEIMEVDPYKSAPMRVGDVVFFLPPGSDQPVVHRIIRLTPAGISTLGDNNTRDDSYLLPPESIKGRVVAAWRGQKRRKIAGGFPGRLASRWRSWRRVLDRSVSPLLHPFYRALSRRGLFARMLPMRLRPRVVAFHARGRDQVQLLLGKRIIGRYDDKRRQWQIQRPYQLFFAGGTQAGYGDKEGPNRQVLTEWQRAVDHLQAQGVQHELVLVDGSRWGIAAGDGEAAVIVSQLGKAMQLREVADAIGPSRQGDLYRLLVRVDAQTSVADCYVPLAAKKGGVVLCVLSPSDHWGGPSVNLARLSLVFAREAQARGGVLLHGALAELGGDGVILLAPGGTGKTTASNRLPSPWCSLCDDTTLVVRDAQGDYCAHPWPTWSRFLAGGPGGSWDVQSAVPVKGIFVLAQAADDRVEKVGVGRAVSLLGEFVEQASWFMAPGLSQGELDALHLEQFNNLCALTRAVPAHVLHISLTGAFWKKIERVLQGGPGADI